MMSKKYTAYCLLFTVYFLTGCVVGVETAVSSPPRTTSSIPPGDRATVDFVIDGDTVDVLLGGESYRVRYIGVDTPERDEPFYAEATAANAALVDGAEVILVRDVSETDQYGRLLRYVYLPNGTFVNAELVAQGYARVVTFPPDVAQVDYFSDLQATAREQGLGLWGQSDLSAGAVCDCSGNHYNCADFASRADAQACFDYCMAEVNEDVHHLDGGGDGLVCESLP